MSIEQQVINILQLPAVGYINFTADGFSVTPAAFRLLCVRIRSGVPSVIPVVLPAGRDAVYDFEGDRLLISNALPMALTNSQALIVHECVHALSDVRKLPQKVHFNEAVAYLAQTIFMLVKDRHFRANMAAAGADPFNDMVKETISIVDAHGMVGKSVTLSKGDLRGLIRLVRQVQPYASMKRKDTYDYDGIKRPLTYQWLP